MKNLKTKLTSRKFLAALSGFLVGLGVLFSGNTVEGIVTVLTSIIGYMVAEGYIDAKAVKNTANTVEAVAHEVGKDDELL